MELCYGTAIPTCDCGACDITLETEDGSTAETIPSGKRSNAVFDSVKWTDISGECNSIRIEFVDAR